MPGEQEQAPMAAQHGLVGMVGTGNMGGRMTRRMISAGYAVLAVDAEPARVPACGATPAASLAELAARCDVIMLSLPDSSVIEAVIRGPDGLFDHARDGHVIVTSARPIPPRPANCTMSSPPAAYATWTPGSLAVPRPPSRAR
jgi:phosphoglycerate dehydrogenase-like enzyme